ASALLPSRPTLQLPLLAAIQDNALHDPNHPSMIPPIDADLLDRMEIVGTRIFTLITDAQAQATASRINLVSCGRLLETSYNAALAAATYHFTRAIDTDSLALLTPFGGLGR
ncbi:MAG: hypothetical protein AAFX99_04715, partial [Myxococcota bacterium]